MCACVCVSVCTCNVCVWSVGYFCFVGEGMKVGALALLRDSRSVCVKTSRDSWSFGLKKHSILQEEVLTVFVSGKLLMSQK